MNKPQTAYNITTPQVISALSPLNPITQIIGFIVQTAGTSGVLTFNDCQTLAQASAANQIITLPYNTLSQLGVASALNLPIQNGLVVSAVPSGMVLAVEYAIYVPG
jgi:hypothetical protein